MFLILLACIEEGFYMYGNIYPAGAIVKIPFGLYEHFAIVSDRRSLNGKPNLISLSARRNTVCEESWDQCAKGRSVILNSEQGIYPAHIVLARAKASIGKKRWHFLKYNCEHFAYETHGLGVVSRQVNNALLAISALCFLSLITSR